MCRVLLPRLACAAILGLTGHAVAQQPPPDPFADLTPKPEMPAVSTRQSWFRRLFTDNFGFRKEILSQVTTDAEENGYSRQSVGFEVLKKFSTKTATVAAFNVQGRLVRRDGFLPVQNDMEGEHRGGWTFEYHNLYMDFYNVWPSHEVGRVNFRAGRFYVPFGLNLQTDTHAPVLQLSNDRNFGFERDWYTGFWGSLNKRLNYDAYYLAGSGYDLTYRGQRGLGAVRISLANRYSSAYGLEGGVSTLGGERLSMDRHNRRPIGTRRVGIDGRYRRAVPTGLFTWTTEFITGQDDRAGLRMQLHQAEYLHASRRWGVATQYRRFQTISADAALAAEFTWYFRNDVGNSNLHWIKLNLERRLERMLPTTPRTAITLQYYFYR